MAVDYNVRATKEIVRPFSALIEPSMYFLSRTHIPCALERLETVFYHN